MPPEGGAGRWERPGESFYEVLTAAVIDMAEHGYDSPDRVALWTDRLRRAAIREMIPPETVDKTLRATMQAVYRSKVERGGILRLHPGVQKFTLARIAPRLRTELDRRIMASASLIRLNREEAMQKTLRRFQGWATSIPPGGSETVDRAEIKEQVRKPLRSLSFEERRVATDQGHKLVANINELLAEDGGAIAGIWRSNWRQLNYNYRKDHRERDGRVYMVRGNWALQNGLVKVGESGYTDDITKPGEEVYCRCYYTWIYAIRRLPDEMLTRKGRETLGNTGLAA
jgi:hypothetical protein